MTELGCLFLFASVSRVYFFVIGNSQNTAIISSRSHYLKKNKTPKKENHDVF